MADKNENRRENGSDSEEPIRESGVDWLEVENELSENLQKTFDSLKDLDTRFDCLGLHNIIRGPEGHVRTINLKNPEGSCEMASAIYGELCRFEKKYENEISMDLEANDSNLNGLFNCYFGDDMTLDMIYYKICHTVCKYYVDQEHKKSYFN